ncbi:type I 3-dehydroquinate dehydratase [Chloroflexota bacterium]
MPDICACITRVEDLEAALSWATEVALYEVRIDLIGPDWRLLAGKLPRPWIACNRCIDEGGKGPVDARQRLGVLHDAVELGATYVDIEVATPDVTTWLTTLNSKAVVILSHHDLEGTPDIDRLRGIAARERESGADICKVVTTCSSMQDNLTVLQLCKENANRGIVAFGMGPLGAVSRVLAPLHGARFSYASLATGHESAPGQLTVDHLAAFYAGLEH